MTIPKISVILPVYNGGKYLKLSVESVLKQDFHQFEFLITDDCSTDGSWEYLQTLDDERIKLFRNKNNKGLFFNLNQMVRDSSSTLIKLWAQDDIMYPFCLGSFVHFHRDHPEVGFSYSARDIIDEDGRVVKPFTYDKTPTIVSTEKHAEISFEYGSIAGNIANVCITRDALNKVGLYNEMMKISADFDMQVRIARYFPVGFLRKPLIQLRDHDKQLSRNAALYIYHVKEDLEIYKYLMGYVNPSLQKKGQRLLRKQKLMFHYTLMLQALFRGQTKLAKEYYELLSAFDSFPLLSLHFIKSRLKRLMNSHGNN
ncbi:MAG TPA: glycosyltransferase [Ferruginibacter sp.]|nr:glycosyltransferase [Ferruginibacter sp.]HRO16567.1 glycosyltransferase [Ferruginibacter sp.]HRQ19924.1 glycosyltransferase [Ferruginibacter sp.]